MTRVVCISDTHNKHSQIIIPDGDILIHAGDFTYSGSLTEFAAFGNWLHTLPHQHKVVVCGNHDFYGEHNLCAARHLLNGATLLQDQCETISGHKIYGSAWTPWFAGWAFNLRRGPEIAEKWEQIPDDTEILITHGPPSCIGDLVNYEGTLATENVGCHDLSRRLGKLGKLRAHIYGHIHDCHGRRTINGIDYVNASVCNDYYQVAYSPIVLDL